MVAKDRQRRRRDFSKCSKGHEMSERDWGVKRQRRKIGGPMVEQTYCRKCSKENNAKQRKKKAA